MPSKRSDSAAASQQRQLALSSDEGGAGPRRPQERSIFGKAQSEVPQLTNAELVQLRIRAIALENLAEPQPTRA